MRRSGRGALDFEDLYEESFPRVYNYLFAHTLDATLSESIASDAFVLAWRKLSTYDPQRAKFSTWVIAIARNLLSTHFKAARETESLDAVPETLAAAQDEDHLATRDEVAWLLSKLSPSDRELVYLRYWEELSPADIGRLTNTNPSTVRSRLYRALERMRHALLKVSGPQGVATDS